MTFNDKINNLTKQQVDLLTIQLDYCSRTFGTSPCLATGAKCYNTFGTCKYKTAFSKTTKDYDLCSNNASIAMCAALNAKPLYVGTSSMPTELSEDKTIPARVTFTIADEPDYDVGIDPYLSTRVYDILDTKGTFVKKLLARNPNYKGRPVFLKQGFEGLTKADFVQRFRGKIENIKRSRTTASIECVDLLKSLDDYEYPLKLNNKIAEDMGAAYEVASQEEMLTLKEAKVNDIAIRTDFGVIKEYSTAVVGSMPNSDYHYEIVAYDAKGDPIAYKYVWISGENDGLGFPMDVHLAWDAVTGATYYRVYGREMNPTTYLITTATTLVDDGTLVFNYSGSVPTLAQRYFELTLDDYTNVNSWTQVYSLTLELDSVEDLDAAGYLRIEDECISYSSISGTTLQGVKRMAANTDGDERHYAGTNVKLVLQYAPQNPFTILMDIYDKANITSTYYEQTKLQTYRDAYAGINFSTLPIFKDTTLSKIVFDLVNMLDGKIWQNENGKLDFKYQGDTTITATITDAENIVMDSTGVDDNLNEIKTRLLCYWGRYDVTKALTDKNNYQGLHIEINADDESANMYNDKLEQEFTTTWINSDCGTTTEINEYLTNLFNAKLERKHVPRPVLTFDVELKDSDILVGDCIYLRTDEFNETDGTDYYDRTFEVVKKEFKETKLTLKVRFVPTDAATTESEDHTIILENPIPVAKTSLNEIKVTGLTYIDADDEEHTGASLDLSVSNSAKLCWDNMYMSEEETYTDINGATYTLPTKTAYAGIPPHPISQSTDLSSWKTIRQYTVYLGVLYDKNVPFTYSRPTSNDPNGKWYKLAIVPDLKATDKTKKYYFEYTFPPSLLGKGICFAVYADARMTYDPDAPIGMDITLYK